MCSAIAWSMHCQVECYGSLQVPVTSLVRMESLGSYVANFQGLAAQRNDRHWADVHLGVAGNVLVVHDQAVPRVETE